MDPETFDVAIDGKAFTNSDDRDVLKNLFRRARVSYLTGVREPLRFAQMPVPDPKDARNLARCPTVLAAREYASGAALASPMRWRSRP